MWGHWGARQNLGGKWPPWHPPSSALACNSKEPLQQHAEGRTPWEKCGVDLFEFNQKYYLVTVDYFSNFFEIDVLTSTTASAVNHCLKRHFARNVLCLIQALSLCPASLRIFVRHGAYCILLLVRDTKMRMGKQAAVKPAKYMLKRTALEHQDEYLALLELRNTPRQDVRKSPSKIMFGRVTFTYAALFYLRCPNLATTLI